MNELEELENDVSPIGGRGDGRTTATTTEKTMTSKGETKRPSRPEDLEMTNMASIPSPTIKSQMPLSTPSTTGSSKPHSTSCRTHGRRELVCPILEGESEESGGDDEDDDDDDNLRRSTKRIFDVFRSTERREKRVAVEFQSARSRHLLSCCGAQDRRDDAAAAVLPPELRNSRSVGPAPRRRLPNDGPAPRDLLPEDGLAPRRYLPEDDYADDLPTLGAGTSGPGEVSPGAASTPEKVFVGAAKRIVFVDATKGDVDSFYRKKFVATATVSEASLSDLPSTFFIDTLTSSTGWNVPPPKIIFSIVGTADKMTGKTLADCQALLTRLATSLHSVMFLTTGMNNGTLERLIVGKVLKRLKEKSITSSDIDEDPPNFVGLGVVAANRVANMEKYWQAFREDIDWRYEVNDDNNESYNSDVAQLNPHHTHFLIIETPFSSQLGCNKSSDKDFMNKVRSELELQWHKALPLAQLLFGGDATSLQRVADALDNGVPCIIIAGTGGAADVMAALKAGRTDPNILDAAVDSIFGSKSEIAKKSLKEMEPFQHLVHLLRPDDDDRVDVRVCNMILECREVDKTSLALGAQLGMRPWIERGLDVIEKEFESVQQMILKLLVSNDSSAAESIAAFFDLIPGKKLDRAIKRIVETKLEYLYRPKRFPQYVKDRISYFSLRCWTHRKNVKYMKELVLEDFISLTGGSALSNFCFNKNEIKSQWLELLLWALLTGKLEVAWIVLSKRRVPHQMGAALFACCVLQKMIKITNLAQADEASETLNTYKIIFENAAVQILNQCHHYSQYRTQLLLLQALKSFGRVSCFQLATIGNCLDFVAQDACQNHLNNIWFGLMSPQTSSFKIIPIIALPPLVPFLINQRAKTKEEPDTSELIHLRPKLRNDLYSIGVDPGQSPRGPRYHQRVANFYFSASVKFFVHFLLYITFLIIFGIFICIIDPVEWASGWSSPKNPHVVVEILIYAFWLNFLVNEVTQLANESGNLRNKFARHYGFSRFTTSFVFNLLDLIIVVLCSIGFVIRVTLERKGQVTAQAAFLLHHFYIAIFMLYCLRLLQTYLFFTELGPKLLMLRGIFVDFFHFLAIVFVFWSAFGVAAFAVLRPLRRGVGLAPPHWLYDVAGIFLDPYWPLFGSNTDFAEKLEGGNESLKSAATYPTRDHEDAILNVMLPLVEATYMLFGVFLLLNLIIALFSNTIESINKNSQKIYKFSRVEMIYEYHERTIWPAPFSMLFRLCFVLIRLWTKLTTKICRRRNPRILKRQVVSKMICLDFHKLLVEKHRIPDGVVDRFLHLLRKYEKNHAAYIKFKTFRNFRNNDQC